MFLERHFIIQELLQPISIRAALTSWFVPRKWQHELRQNRSILINHRYLPFNSLVCNGDQIDLHFQTERLQQVYLPATQTTFKVRLENDDLIIVDKPAGLKTHPNQPTENQTLMNQVRYYLGFNPLMIHRLDQMTSGLIMIGKNPLVIPLLNRQLAKKIMQRYYLAVVCYNSKVAPIGSINAPISRSPSDPRKRQINSKGLSAQTDYQILQHNSKYALVQLQLHTGRTHQIRVHLQALGMPILGDPLYGPKASRMYLHAYQLHYQIPFSYQQQIITCNCPNSFYNLSS